MENNFTKVMSNKTDEELIKIVTVDIGKYQILAIEAAKEEIASRNIDINRIKEIEAKLELQKQKLDKVENNTVHSKIRFVNFLIDFILVFVLYFSISPNIESLLSLTAQYERAIYRIAALLIFIAIYYIVLEHKYQKTLGKIITKTKVVNLEGEKAELSDIVNRTFCRLIPFDRVSFFFSRNGIHDVMSKTKVIKD
ncbi:putative RDD family membrane protein YckC [Flavobacterium nitrogenifigens]|uniref:RDD family membrane protein YckC n=2 Tax=Flavobacterium TaxID=237 RepID=A0ABR6QAG6_9FLAO|nr:MULTISPECIES: RDD family protein [Flavobacterium]MBB4800046.1 putative RDD family membrane protein YckC [Flavobacterium nitrogenifigens]MBB6386204.1 putative RDD family membrane protein YckC [Flavobacterium notoginsengisoli]